MTCTVRIDGQNIHYYQGGSGPALILLHASPLSHKVFSAWFPRLEAHFTVIALDTPGQGKSQPFALNSDKIEPFTALLDQFIDLLGIQQCFIYGSATGAQWGISYAKTHPTKVAHLFIDNAAHFEDDLRERIMADYFPNLTPQEDGSHLKTTWHMVDQLFQYFPWCFAEEQYKLATPKPPISVAHQFTLSYLQAGTSWDKAYKAAFKHEKAAYVNQLKVPTTLFRYGGSIILPHINDLVERVKNEKVSVIEIVANPVERLTQMFDHMAQSKQAHTCVDCHHKTDLDFVEEPTMRIPDFPCAPDVREDGQHLKEAWQYLSKYFPNEPIATRQSYLLKWLS